MSLVLFELSPWKSSSANKAIPQAGTKSIIQTQKLLDKPYSALCSPAAQSLTIATADILRLQAQQ